MNEQNQPDATQQLIELQKLEIFKTMWQTLPEDRRFVIAEGYINEWVRAAKWQQTHEIEAYIKALTLEAIKDQWEVKYKEQVMPRIQANLETISERELTRMIEETFKEAGKQIKEEVFKAVKSAGTYLTW